MRFTLVLSRVKVSLRCFCLTSPSASSLFSCTRKNTFKRINSISSKRPLIVMTQGAMDAAAIPCFVSPTKIIIIIIHNVEGQASFKNQRKEDHIVIDAAHVKVHTRKLLFVSFFLFLLIPSTSPRLCVYCKTKMRSKLTFSIACSTLKLKANSDYDGCSIQEY